MLETPRRPVADLLREFHTRPGADYVSPDTPTVAVPGGLCRTEYLIEQAAQLRAAVAAGDLIGAADALADLVYLAYGTAWRFGIDLDVVVAEVHRSNLTKTPAPGDGTAIKGPDYSPPDIAAALTAASQTTSLPPGFTVQQSTCLTVTCRGCATGLGEDDDIGAALHFPDITAAQTAAEASGWTCTTDGALCAHCTAQQHCALLGPLPGLDLDGIGWVITGGESGPRARPIDPQWVLDIRDICLRNQVPFFHKQWGGRSPKAGGRLLDGRTWDQFPTVTAGIGVAG